ncbi:hypothetical protein [Nocardia asiatica]
MAYERWHEYRHTGPLPRWRTDSPDGKNVELYWQRSLEALAAAKRERTELSEWQCAFIKRVCVEKHARRAAA